MEDNSKIANGTNINECESVTYNFINRESNLQEFESLPMRTFSHIEDKVNGIQILMVHDIYHLSVYKRLKDKEGNWLHWIYICDFIHILESGGKIEDDDVRKALKTLFCAMH